VANSELKILSANTIALEYLGLTKENLKEKTVGEIYSIKKDESDSLLSRTLSGMIIHLDNPIKGKDGKSLQADTRVVAGKRNDDDILYFVSRCTSVQ
jgi:PAS domain-containing protein